MDNVCPLVLGAEHDSCCLVCGPFLLPLFIYSFGTETVFFFLFFFVNEQHFVQKGFVYKVLSVDVR